MSWDISINLWGFLSTWARCTSALFATWTRLINLERGNLFFPHMQFSWFFFCGIKSSSGSDAEFICERELWGNVKLTTENVLGVLWATLAISLNKFHFKILKSSRTEKLIKRLQMKRQKFWKANNKLNETFPEYKRLHFLIFPFCCLRSKSIRGVLESRSVFLHVDLADSCEARLIKSCWIQLELICSTFSSKSSRLLAAERIIFTPKSPITKC